MHPLRLRVIYVDWAQWVWTSPAAVFASLQHCSSVLVHAALIFLTTSATQNLARQSDDHDHPTQHGICTSRTCKSGDASPSGSETLDTEKQLNKQVNVMSVECLRIINYMQHQQNHQQFQQISFQKTQPYIQSRNKQSTSIHLSTCLNQSL